MPGQVILLRAATEEVLPGFMGSIQLKCNPANVDLRRLRGGQMRLLVDHDETRPVGMVTSLKAGNGEVVGEAELIETESTRSPIEDINSSLKSGLSFGFLVHKTRLLKPGESGYDEDSFNLIVERWEPYECSAVATPRGVRSKITGGLVHPPSRDAASVSTSVDAKTARPKTTTKTTKRPRTVSRRTLDSGLEREGSPAPKRPLTIPLQRDYMKEQHVAITASLASLGGSSTSPPGAGGFPSGPASHPGGVSQNTAGPSQGRRPRADYGRRKRLGQNPLGNRYATGPRGARCFR